MPRKLLIGLLAFGTVVGFGSGFASVARRMHGGYGGGCHSWRSQHGGPNGPGYSWNRGPGPGMNARQAQPDIAPVAAAVPPPSPAAVVAAPAPTPVAAPASAPISQQPTFIFIPQPAPVQVPTAAPAAQAAPALQDATQPTPIQINLTVSPDGRVQLK